MSTYVYIAKVKIQSSLAYSFDVFGGLLWQCIVMFSLGFFWKAVYANADVVKGVNVNDMVTYTIMSLVISTFFWNGVEDRINDSVKTGGVALDMLKPINPYMIYLSEDIGYIIVGIFQNVIPVLIIGTLFFSFPMPASPVAFVLFLVSLLLSFGINWLFSALFSMLAYKVVNMWSMFGLKWNLTNLLSGAAIPIWFFPEQLQFVLKLLPFMYIYQAPLGIFIGKFSGAEALTTLAIQALWVIILAVSFAAAQKAARKFILVQGG